MKDFVTIPLWCCFAMVCAMLIMVAIAIDLAHLGVLRALGSNKEPALVDHALDLSAWTYHKIVR